MANISAPKRKYDSSRRQAQAARTRRRILDAAQRRFEADGYVPTTVEAIAEDASVALKTVYSAFGTKAGLLRAVWDLLLKGDTDDAPVAERAWYQRLLEEPDPDEMVRLCARQFREIKERIGPILGVIRSAATVDADSAALWQLIQTDFHANQGVIVQAIHERGGLRAGLTVAEATDILWTLNHPAVWLLLVGERGWTPARFEAWFAETMAHQLFGR